MTDARVLILGGTSEARALARELSEQQVDFVSSLAGRVSSPRLPVGHVRIGGFGGAPGLSTALRDEGFTHLVDATHPFAVNMRRHAAAAASQMNIPVLRLARPGWRARPDSLRWHWVPTYEEADAVSAGLGSRPFITSGRQTLDHYSRLRERQALVRLVEPAETGTLPDSWTVLLSRGPFSVDAELALMREYNIDVVITKDSGGEYTCAKLDAAARLDIPIVVVERPPPPDGMPEVETLHEVLAWLGPSPER